VHPWRKIIDAVFTACADPAGVAALGHGALERVALLLDHWRDTPVASQSRPTPVSWGDRRGMA